MMSTVLTLTFNPALDQTITLDRLQPGTVHRASAVHTNAGGKGINVASCLADWGVPVAATGILGRANAQPFEALFADKGIADHCVRVDGETRVNIKIADQSNADTTDINLPGLVLGETVLGAVREQVRETVIGLLQDYPADSAPLVVAAGSVPQGMDPAVYASVGAEIRRFGGRLILDTSGVPLSAALAAPERTLPLCIKPNRAELEQWAATPLDTLEAILTAARRLNRRGIALVVVSLGAEGAVYVSSSLAIRAALPVVRPLSTVGAGDAMVAGLTAALWEDANPETLPGLERIARLSTAFAVGKLERLGPNLPPRATIEALAATVAIEVCA
ncbi:1-phosphofructokinase family hexose kinase [Insolitispirillum peregrinum]|uniref:Phosphofructokinase n=1 Tax=Insolitispirillum peregrinum TaxID=80876 RepID=A0A1N7LCB9_9PROT|nr:1-phosphofructokinase family hexose kinase [Insolitispirillum peregrinum]SIS71456.1 fructose-1-phosphate kinase [Insolitispirillum peregrinum]